MREQPAARLRQGMREQPFGIDAVDAAGGLAQQAIDGRGWNGHRHSVASPPRPTERTRLSIVFPYESDSINFIDR